MKLTPYKEALKMGKEKMSNMLAPVKAKRAKKQAELEMVKIEEEIATAEATIHEECAKEDVSFPKIIELQNKLGLLERKQQQYEKILLEMFPEE